VARVLIWCLSHAVRGVTADLFVATNLPAEVYVWSGGASVSVNATWYFAATASYIQPGASYARRPIRYVTSSRKCAGSRADGVCVCCLCASVVWC
jgi:hypothetical protein